MASSRRDISYMMQIFRQFLLGRVWNKQLRYKADMSPRSPPHPLIPSKWS